MKTHKYEFELTSEESEHVFQALSKLLQDNFSSIIGTMASDKTEDCKKAEIQWYVDNSEWFVRIMKKMGFDPSFDETLKRLRKIHNLTDVEPDKSVGAATTNDDGLAGMYSKRLH